MTTPQSDIQHQQSLQAQWAQFTPRTSGTPSEKPTPTPSIQLVDALTPAHSTASGDDLPSQTAPLPGTQPSSRQWGTSEHRLSVLDVLNLWKWELGSLLVAVGLISAIIGLLAYYNHRELSEWHLSMNLSTLVALLSTIIRAGMVMIVAGVISQLKWSWFTERPHPLSQLQDFDAGSRSGIGSLRLIWILLTRSRSKSILAFHAVLAAAVGVLSFLVGPFMQQAIRSDICPRVLPDVNSSIPVANYVEGRYYRVAAGAWEVTVDMKGVMVQGLTNPSSQDLAIKPFCPTGNCTFPDYGTGVTHSTIGMCSKCRDITADVEGPDESGNVTLSLGENQDPLWIALYGLQLGVMPFLSTTTSFRDPLAESAFLGIPTGSQSAIKSVTVLTASNSPCTNTSSGELICPHRGSADPVSPQALYGGVGDFVAATCTLYPCLRSYSGSVVDGVLRETLVSTTPAVLEDTDSFIQSNYTAVRSPCVLDSSGTSYTETNFSSAPAVPGRTFSTVNLAGVNTTVPNACLYKLTWIYSRAMSLHMSSLFDNGQCIYDRRQGEELWCSPTWWLSPLYASRNASLATISNAMDAFASAITTKFRTAGYGPDDMHGVDLGQGTGYAVKGQVTRNSICMSLDWRWVLLPLVLLVVSAALLVWMVARNLGNRGDPVWKANVLPLVLFGLGGHSSQGAQERVTDRPGLRRVNTTLQAVEQKARDIRVRCVVDESGKPGFVTEDDGLYKGDGLATVSMDSLLVQNNPA